MWAVVTGRGAAAQMLIDAQADSNVPNKVITLTALNANHTLMCLLAVCYRTATLCSCLVHRTGTALLCRCW
jgi:hypothetical protein